MQLCMLNLVSLFLIYPLPIVSALGINCRGSALCPRASWNNPNSESIIQILHDVIHVYPGSNSTTYDSGDHIICLSQSQPIGIGIGIDGVAAGGSIGLSGTIPEGGICLFPQRTSLNLEQIKPLVDAILDHGCTTCGSVPIHFVDEGSNDPSDGILTFNYVADPFCDGSCISDDGTVPSSGSQSPENATDTLTAIETIYTSTVGPETEAEVPTATITDGGAFAAETTSGNMQVSVVTFESSYGAAPTASSGSGSTSGSIQVQVRVHSVFAWPVAVLFLMLI